MILVKLIKYYSIIFIIYNIIKNYLREKNEIKKIDEKNDQNINKNSKKQKEKCKKQNEENHEVNEKKINEELILYNKKSEKIDDELLKKSLKELKPSKLETIILQNDIHNLIIDNINENNYLHYTFETNKDMYYKIIFKAKMENACNIKVMIFENNNENKKYEEEIEDLMEFRFILDNNQFTFKENKIINIYIYFLNKIQNNDNEEIIINDFFIDIIEKPNKKAKDALLIHYINDKYEPYFLERCNIII